MKRNMNSKQSVGVQYDPLLMLPLYAGIEGYGNILNLKESLSVFVPLFFLML